MPGFSFATDTFAFPNDIRSRNPDAPDLYANYCFVLARSLRQFFAFARFDPSAPRLGSRRVRRARSRGRGARAVGASPAARGARGHPRLSGPARLLARRGAGRQGEPRAPLLDLGALDELARGLPGDRRAIRPASRGRSWTRSRTGRLVQLLVTNWPKPELNHTVVAYEFREEHGGASSSWCGTPTIPTAPGRLTFDRQQSRFWATRVYDTEPGVIRVFRMYYSPWL